LPSVKKGRTRPTFNVINHLYDDPPVHQFDEAWLTVREEKGKRRITPVAFGRNMVPDVTGMGLRDAILLLEELGVKVQAEGRGVVISQSIAPGTKINVGSEIMLTLN
jgi:Uncharacterized protein conserved in bacteria